MCEERQTHSDRTLPGLTNPIRSTMRETATSSLSLKHRLTFCPLSAFIRRTGRQGATLPWAAFQAKPLTVFFLNARTPKKCSSALTATPQEGSLHPLAQEHSGEIAVIGLCKEKLKQIYPSARDIPPTQFIAQTIAFESCPPPSLSPCSAWQMWS